MVAILDARSQKLFAMDGQTGSITTSARLDRETMDVHYLRVTATETTPGVSGRQRSATTTVQINVEDVNDFPPTFEQSGAYETAVKESASIGIIAVIELSSHAESRWFLYFVGFLRSIFASKSVRFCGHCPSYNRRNLNKWHLKKNALR